MNILTRMDQHIAELKALLESESHALVEGVDQLGNESKSRVEILLAKMKNDWHKMMSYIEKKGSELK